MAAAYLARASAPTSLDWTISLFEDATQVHTQLAQARIDPTTTMEHIAVDIVGIIAPNVPEMFGFYPHGSVAAA